MEPPFVCSAMNPPWGYNVMPKMIKRKSKLLPKKVEKMAEKKRKKEEKKKMRRKRQDKDEAAAAAAGSYGASCRTDRHLKQELTQSPAPDHPATAGSSGAQVGHESVLSELGSN